MEKRNAFLMGAASGLVISSSYIAAERGIRGFAMIFIVLGLFGAVHAVQAWRRARLGFASTAMGISATAAMAVGIALYRGGSVDGMHAPAWALLSVGSVLGTGVLLFLEGRRSPRRWAAWREGFQTARLSEILLGKHFPDVRHDGV